MALDPVKKPEAKIVEPAAPPKQYQVTEEFVTAGGARYLEGAVISLTAEEAEKALADGAVAEWVPPPDLAGHAKGPGVAPHVPPKAKT